MIVSQERGLIALFDQVRSTHGRLDYLFNNAGIAGPGWNDFAQWPETVIDQMLATNVKGVYMGIQHAMGLMADSGGGVIVNCSSPGGTIAFMPETAIYTATKAAVTALTRSTRPLLAEKGIRTYAIGPFTTETPIFGQEIPPEMRAFLGSLNPSGRLGRPEDVAALVVALMEGSTSFESGDMIYIDNGRITRLDEPTMG